MGLHARLMSQALRKLTGSISRSRAMVIFINQIRHKIGVMFGNPETTTGGNALKFYASVRLDIRRIGAIKERDQVIGNQTRVKVVKNKMAPPFKVVDFDIMYGEGISKRGELIDLGVQAGVVEKSGSWFSYDGQRIGQGRENAKAHLKEHAEIGETIEHAIRGNAGLVAEAMMAAPEKLQPKNSQSVSGGDSRAETIAVRVDAGMGRLGHSVLELWWCSLNQVGGADPEALKSAQSNAGILQIIGSKRRLRKHLAVTLMHGAQAVPQLTPFLGQSNMDRAPIVH